MKLKTGMLVAVLAGMAYVNFGGQSTAFAAESQTKTGVVKKVDAAAKQRALGGERTLGRQPALTGEPAEERGRRGHLR